MKAPWSGQLSAAKTGWLVMLLFFGWLGYLLVPAPKPKPSSPPAPVKAPPSRLVALGLPDNPDLEHLSDFFAVYADQAEWKNDKTQFAYWNPGSKSYSYFFEATRNAGRYRYRQVSREDFSENFLLHYDSVPKIHEDEMPELRAESSTHPFVFASPPVIVGPMKLAPPLLSRPTLAPEIMPKPQINVSTERLKLPPPVIQKQ